MNWASKTGSGNTRILVLGYLVRGPMGGMAWHHLQYMLGLHRMGYEVYYLEDSGDTIYSCYNPSRGVTDKNPDYGLRFAAKVFDKVGLKNQWAYFDKHRNRWEGPLTDKVKTIITGADLLINLSCSNPIRSWLSHIPVRVLVDTDPVFTQIRNLTDPVRQQLADQHNAFFSFGENFGRPGCSIPDDGLPWQPTRQPVVLDAWPVTPGPAKGPFTTVMQWESYPAREYRGRRYGLKADAFEPYLDLPRKTNCRLELAIGGHSAPRQRLQESGWSLCNPLEVTGDPWEYQRYIQKSKGEFSIAKHAYVEAYTGWFSERSAAYMASGRPVVIQDAGFSRWLETGTGAVAFRTPDEALAGIESILSDYEGHCRAARNLAREYFDAEKVLASLLERARTGQHRYSDSQ